MLPRLGLAFLRAPHMGRTAVRRVRSRACTGMALQTVALLVACASPTPTPLYQQLGGVDAISAVSGNVLDRVAADPRTRRTFGNVKMSFLKQSVSNYLCKVADGPCVYEGESMQKSHQALNITGSEFDVMVQVLREELDAAGVAPAAKNELLRRLAPSRRDMVKS